MVVSHFSIKVKDNKGKKKKKKVLGKKEAVLWLMKHSQVRKTLTAVSQGLFLGPLSFLISDS